MTPQTSEPAWRINIRTALKKRGITYYRLAQLTGIRQSRFSRWNSGTGEPGPDELVSICKALDVSLDWLLLNGDPAMMTTTRTPEETKLIERCREIGIDRVYRLIIREAVELREVIQRCQ